MWANYSKPNSIHTGGSTFLKKIEITISTGKSCCSFGIWSTNWASECVLKHIVPAVPAVEQLPVQAPAQAAHSRQLAVCSTQPRLHCNPADLQLQLLRLRRLLYLVQLLLRQQAGLKSQYTNFNHFCQLDGRLIRGYQKYYKLTLMII